MNVEAYNGPYNLFGCMYEEFQHPTQNINAMDGVVQDLLNLIRCPYIPKWDII